eukprot:TRINITY_DN168_c0_g1_i4.p1 TRINITY_DN168_c0_g1~~TRINITY_DN168_c0_g1_i4.p1  ORF type:complete len:966 (-),score=275.19 TRINITY_DN168_c0_g1_i4:176-3031(-)
MWSICSVRTLEELEAWIDRSLEEELDALKISTQIKRNEFRKHVNALKVRLNSLENDEIGNLHKQYNLERNRSVRKKLGESIIKAQRLHMQTDSWQQTKVLFDKLERELDLIDHFDRSISFGKSNRSLRAVDAFSSSAGFLLPNNATLDDNGNAKGREHDLGVMGAFRGLKIVVYKQFDCDFYYAREALEEKGFTVEVYNRFPTFTILQEELQDANQFWLLGGHLPVFSEKEIELVLENHRDGMGLFLLGDNNPFYVDSNRILSCLNLPQMNGNYLGCEYLKPYNPKTGKGYIPHLLTTGISNRLYEGSTISEFDAEDVEKADCVPIIFDSRGEVSVFVREAKDFCGPVIGDSGASKLFCQSMAGGDTRFATNCACYLATEYLSKSDEEILKEKQIYDEKREEIEMKYRPLNFDYEGAFLGECDITFEVEPMAVLAVSLGDVYQNTSDFALNDPLGCGKRNLVLGHQMYSVPIAMDMLAGGMDPFRRTPAMAVIPAVSLGNKTNFKLMTEIICKVFMAGKNLPKYAWMIFYGVCDEMAGQSETEHKKIWEYFCDEMLKHVYSTPDFTDMGKQVPLLKAMETFGGATDEMEQLRKSFTTTCLMARALFRKDVMSVPKLVPWVRHALIKVIAGIVLNLGKKKDEDKKNKAWFDDQFDNKHYDRYYGICLNDSAHVLPLKESLKWFIPAFKAIEASLDRVCNTLGVEEILNDNQVAVLLSVLRFKWNKNKLAKYTLENFMTAFLDDVDVKKVWKGETVDPTELLNERFEGFFHPKDEKYNPEDLPAFITPFGCSCFVSRCGETKFGDWTNEITEEESEKIKQVRNEYLKSTYGTDDPNGYPTAKNKKHTPLGSAHYPFHRGVQRVMTRPEFKEDKEVNEKHIKAICEYLLKQKKGDFYFRGIENVMKKGVESYLVCRRKGMVEPGHDEPINFFKKLQEERQARLSGLTDDIPAFV